ncbi:MAG: hypothetical protein IJF18_04840 [Oscillospiraceae bacterium]|nr:hypothetical protein [Oscillospiraceae bacterium]
MDDIISSIIEIDRSAKEKIAEAEKQKKKIVDDAAAERKNLIEGKMKEADERLKKMADDERRLADERFAEINKKCDEGIGRLDEIYNSRHKEWEDKIFNAVISG